MKQLLIVIGFVSLLNSWAQDIYAMPEARMYSTSAMLGSGSSLPLAAVTGTTTTYDDSAQAMSGPRRIIGDDDKDDKEDNGWAEPGVPLGDAVLPLLLLAAGYLLLVARKRRAQDGAERL